MQIKNMESPVKTVIVINGVGGVGKDTLCAAAETCFRVRNVSSITPVKEIAATCGWDGKKNEKARRFLSDLKAAMIAYNDYPTKWAVAQYRDFLAGDEEIMFLHVREPEEIAKFVRATEGKALTLLVRAEQRLHHGAYGNASDDSVENYDYDYIFDNDGSVQEAGRKFIQLLEHIRHADAPSD